MKKLVRSFLLLPLLFAFVPLAGAEQIIGLESETAAAAGTIPDKYVTTTAIGADKYGLDVVMGAGVPPVPTVTATFAAESSTGFAAIGAAYALGVDLPDGTKVVILDNQTNGDVVVSMDAGVTTFKTLKAGDALILPLAQAGLITTGIVHLKDGTTAATAGAFLISSYK